MSHGDEHVVVTAHEADGAQEGGHGDGRMIGAPGCGSYPQVDGTRSVGGRAFLRAGDDCARAFEGASQGDGFADEEAQAHGMFRVQLGESAGVGAGQGQRRQGRSVTRDVAVQARTPRGARLTDKGGRVRRRRRGLGGLRLVCGTAREDTRNHVSTLRQGGANPRCGAPETGRRPKWLRRRRRAKHTRRTMRMRPTHSGTVSDQHARRPQQRTTMAVTR